MSYIEVEDLNKHFTVRKRKKGSLLREKTQVQALSSLSFTAEQGELVGYIGPNGAGKSTTVKILSGILTPDSGRAVIGGLCPWNDRKKHVARIGVVFGQRMQLWWDVPIRDSYELLRDIYRIGPEDYRKRMAQLTEELNLGEIMNTPLRTLSLGQRMRAELAGSLLHRPELLFLDEPTIGLDAVSKLMIRDFLKEENRRNGTTVMLTTHDIEDISALCSRVMVIGRGTKLYDGSLSGLLSAYDTEHVMRVRFDTPVEEISLPEGCTAAQEGNEYVITYPPALLPTPALIEKLQRCGRVGELTAQMQSVDRLVAKMYREMEV